MLAAAVDDLEVLLLARGDGRVAQEQLREAEDGIQGRADLVRHVCQEGALGAVGGICALLGSAQFLVVLVLGDVDHDAGEADRLAVAQHDARGDQCGELRAVLAPDRVFARGDLAGGQDLADPLPCGGALLLGDHLQAVHAGGQVAVRVSEPLLQRLVGIEHTPGGVELEDAGGQQHGQLAEPLFAFAQRILRLLAHQRRADVRGDPLQDLHLLQREGPGTAVIQVDQADDPGFIADRNHGNRGKPLMEALVAGVGGLMAGRLAQQGRIVDPVAPAAGENRVGRVGSSG